MKRITKHFLFWLSILIYFILFDYLTGADSLWIALLSNGVFLPHDIFLTYVIMYLLIPKLFFNKRYILFFTGLLGVLIVNVLISFLIFDLVVDLPNINVSRKSSIQMVFTSNMSFVFVASLALAMKSVDINNHRLLLKEQADSRYHKAEAALLRSQINPHFLFNTLNNINTLVFIDQQKTYDSVIRLSEIMRYMHEKQNGDFISLGREMDYIHSYVDLQKLRFKDENSVKLELEVEDKSLMVAPLIFIAFVENAFKHCDKKDQSPSIFIQIGSGKGSITLMVENHHSGKKEETSSQGGFGIRNIRQRLNLLYPDSHTLQISDTGSYFKVYLKLEKID